MKTFVALALVASTLAKPMPVPRSSAPKGCSDSHDGTFQISAVNVTQSAKREVAKRQQSGTLTLTLSGGVLKDQAGRTGYIASNNQFQFDNPPQENALETSGFSLCSNNSLALGDSAVWYQCYSGGFYNLYDDSQGAQCNQIYIIAVGSSSAPVTQISDGQPQASTGVPVSQISDGQPQAPTAAPITQISDGQPQAPTGAPITQISDGQPQAPTGPVISQISDGQPQVPTATATASGPVITQISDGQPQVPTSAPTSASAPVITQISDGQPQAPTATASGNYTAPNATTASPPEFTGAATTHMAGIGAFAAGLIVLVVML